MAMQKLRGSNGRTKVMWNDEDKVDIAGDIYEKFMEDITVPLLDLVKQYCSEELPHGKQRNIASLSQVTWLQQMLRHLHHQDLATFQKIEHELRTLHSKAQQPQPTEQERLEKIETSTLIAELTRRALLYSWDVKDMLNRTSRRYSKL